MRAYGLAALFAAYAAATPFPQEIDWDAVEALPDLPTPSIPVVNAEAAQTTIPFDLTEAVDAVEAAVLANPNDKLLERRQNSVGGCSPDTKTAKQWQGGINSSSEPTPAGYTRVFTNLKAATHGAYGYMGFAVLNAGEGYTAECARRCNELTGCQSFNTYFERSPSVDPTDSCPNPASETVLKCVFYGGPTSTATATNSGQWRKSFEVVIAGSNGYLNPNIPTPPGYGPAVSLGKASINAPGKNCAGDPTYIGVKTFQDGPFSADKCAAACSATSEWNRAHPHVWRNGRPRLCQMFVTYILNNGTNPTGQFCAMYDQTWDAAFATNQGQWRDNGKSWFNVDFSYMFSNTTGNADQPPPQTCDNPTKPNQAGVCHDPLQYWSTKEKFCVAAPTCDAASEYFNAKTQSCTKFPTCLAETQFLDKAKKECVNYLTCADDTTHYLDKTKNECIAYPICNDDQALDKEMKSCKTCLADTQFLDKAKKECVPYMACDDTTHYLDKTTNECIAYLICNADQTLDKETKSCKMKIPVCVPTNLIRNPGFEQGSGAVNANGNIPFWSNAFNVVNGNVTTGLAESGNQHYLAEFYGGKASTPNKILAYMKQVVPGVVPGKTYRTRFAYGLGARRTLADPKACTLEGGLLIQGVDSPPPKVNPGTLVDKAPGVYSWVDYERTFPPDGTVPAAGIELYFRLYCTGPGSVWEMDFLIDSVSVVDASECTCPENSPTEFRDANTGECKRVPPCPRMQGFNRFTQTCEPNQK